MSPRRYWVYILASRPHGTLYIGVTQSLETRIWQHKTKAVAGFTARYGVDRLVYFEDFSDVRDAIAREKELKDWLRCRKIELIERENPLWRDLAGEWYGPNTARLERSVDDSGPGRAIGPAAGSFAGAQDDKRDGVRWREAGAP